jgi:putative effector of murein hydrolase
MDADCRLHRPQYDRDPARYGIEHAVHAAPLSARNKLEGLAMNDVSSVLMSLWSTPLLPMAMTFGVYHIAAAMHRCFHSHPLLNPIPVSIAVIIGLLLASGTDYKQYFAGVQFMQFLLGPAVVALAIPLHAHWSKLRGILLPIGGALLIGTVTGVTSAVEFARILGGTPDTLVSIAPKSVTTAIAIVLAAQHGGEPSLTAVIVVATCILGAWIGPQLLAAFRVTEPSAWGFAMGIGSNALGTSRALQLSEEAGAFSALAMGLNGVATSLAFPLLLRILGV